jgi:hypothetical protein
MLREQSKVIDALTTKTWPEKWVGDIPDTIAAEFVQAGVAEPLPPEPPRPAAGQQFTAEQAAVLAAAADEIVKQVAMAEAAPPAPAKKARK